MPVDYNLVKRVVTSFNNLHYDKETGILHSLPASRVHELRGCTKLIALNENESIALVTLAASLSEPLSVIDVLLSDYLYTKENRKKGQKTYKHLYEFLTSILFCDKNKVVLQQKVFNLTIVITIKIITST